MLGLIVLCAYLFGGVLQINYIMTGTNRLTKLWIGLVLGFVEMMWLPCLAAFALRFTLSAQLAALGTQIVMTAAIVIFGKRRHNNRTKELTPGPPAWLTLVLMLPILVLTAYLQYTHTLREIDGALYVGQSTYGDLCMHLGFATGLIGQSFPPEYTILPGNLLGYPFLVDALSASMLIFGTPLSIAFVVPGTLMTVLVYMGFFLFAYEITRSKAASTLALILLLFCGGFGFLGTLDMAGGTGFSALETALNGYYKAPANMPEYNLRWVNALCDLLIPQRTLMAGWLVLIPALYLLYRGMKRKSIVSFLGLGMLAGTMPMIHTHSFLGLGVVSLGAGIDTLIRDKDRRLKTFACFAVYGLTACALALPQLLVWTFPQTIDGGSLRLLFNWVNNDNGTLIDGYFWFWIKNVGLMFVLIPIACLSTKNQRVRALALGGLMLFLLAENVVFQPNVYDNNKLFYVVYIALLPAGAALVMDIHRRLKGIKPRCVLLALFVIVSTASGVISIAAEWKSSYRMFSSPLVKAAEFIKENTPQDSVFLTANNHNNSVAALAGRKIVCGSGSYLYYHGLDYQQEEADAVLMLSFPKDFKDLYDKYQVDYVFVSSFEKDLPDIWNVFLPDASYDMDRYSADTVALESLYPVIYHDNYENGWDREEITVYAVSERAIVKFRSEAEHDLK
ncbi:MAG: hypothetical protein K5784_06705 [Clostridiales bacterium]|nr:hypothetical protein [Clostridiales bacterium]